GVQLAHQLTEAGLVFAVEVVVRANVAGQLGAFLLFLERLQHGGLDHLAAGGVDRVGDVGVQLGAAVGVARRPVLVELAAALVAEARPEMVLATTLAATVGQFAAGHGHERALGALDDLEITDNEGVVERHRAEGLQALVLVAIFHELDTDFGDNHSCSPFFLWHTQSQLRTRNSFQPALAGGPASFSCSGPGDSSRARRNASSWSRHRANTLLPLPLIN